MFRKNKSSNLPLENQTKTKFFQSAPSPVDWEKQWERHAKNFFNGKAHIDLSPYGCNQSFALAPGPGFGDLSHETTHLMLSMMSKCVSSQCILDIGCGSGILSIASVCMGASHAYGIDIDSNAITHAHQNASLNQMSDRTNFSNTLPKKARGIVLMNMILSEQKDVLQQIPYLTKKGSLWICSGYLVEQKKEAYSWLQKLGLICIEEKICGEWLSIKGRPNSCLPFKKNA